MPPVTITHIPQNKQSRRCRGHLARILSGGKWRKPASPVQCVKDTRTLYNGAPYCGQHKGQAR